MDKEFWLERWNENRIGFHQGAANKMLIDHYSRFDLPDNGRVFLPLCGKSRDIAWLLDKGHAVAGVELSELAITQLFDDLEVSPEITPAAGLVRYAAPGLDIFVGDIFDLTPETLGHVDGVFDRAALVALPRDIRIAYAAHLARLAPGAVRLLVTFEYDQAKMDGPPFSVTHQEVTQHFARSYHITRLAQNDVQGGFRGRIPAMETAWHLAPK